MISQFERIQEACRLNNVGVMYLSHQDAGGAVKALKDALTIMEGVAAQEESEDLCIPSTTDSLSCPSAVIAGLEDHFYIYNRALLLDASSSSQQMDLAFANAIILFNLALTFHQRGLACGQVPKLQKALYLYDVSTKLIVNKGSASGALALAALNNQAQILFTLGDYAKGRETLDRVRALAEIVPAPETNEEETSATFARYHFDEFYLNVAIVQPPTTAPVA